MKALSLHKVPTLVIPQVPCRTVTSSPVDIFEVKVAFPFPAVECYVENKGYERVEYRFIYFRGLKGSWNELPPLETRKHTLLSLTRIQARNRGTYTGTVCAGFA